jgi:hypothetical protein
VQAMRTTAEALLDAASTDETSAARFEVVVTQPGERETETGNLGEASEA